MKGLFASRSSLAEKWCRVVLAHQHMSCVSCGIPRAPKCPEPGRCEENKVCGRFPKAGRGLPHPGALVGLLLWGFKPWGFTESTKFLPDFVEVALRCSEL